MINYYTNDIEKAYTSETDIKYRRSLGQFFTPFKIASFMAEWVLGNEKDSLYILDPAAGFGVFERAIKDRITNKRIKFDLWELDKNISFSLGKLIFELGLNAEIFSSDFFTAPWDNKYDGIIANPPYYKHHFINNKNEIFQKICVKTFFNFSLQTNVYCWFLIKSMNLLEAGGRLAFIVPSEFLNSNYGEKVKDYLMRSGIVLHLISINFEKNVFDNALTTSAIILAEKKSQKSPAINFFNVTHAEHLDDLTDFLKSYPRRSINTNELDPKIKWRNYFNGYRHKVDDNLIYFSELGRFSRGIATGSNEYFVLTPEEKKKYEIPSECLSPCITKACFVRDIIFTNNDFEYLVKQNKKVYLFDAEKTNNLKCLNYINLGEEKQINKKYLTRNRTPWYALEKREVSKIWVSVFGRKGLKFIWNTSACKNLTCFHAFYPTEFGEKYLSILFIYLNTDFARRLFDHEKREYGNGLEKFEPNDINKSLIFNFDLLSQGDVIRLMNLQENYLSCDNDRRREIILLAESIFRNYYQAA